MTEMVTRGIADIHKSKWAEKAPLCFREVAQSKNDKFCGKVYTVQFTQHTKFCSYHAVTVGFWTLGF